MKDTKISRHIDDLGRIVIPIEIRRSLGIQNKDELTIAVDGDRIVLTKKYNGCVFCEATDNLSIVKNKHICLTCLEEMQ